MVEKMASEKVGLVENKQSSLEKFSRELNFYIIKLLLGATEEEPCVFLRDHSTTEEVGLGILIPPADTVAVALDSLGKLLGKRIYAVRIAVLDVGFDHIVVAVLIDEYTVLINVAAEVLSYVLINEACDKRNRGFDVGRIGGQTQIYALTGIGVVISVIAKGNGEILVRYVDIL